MMFFREAQEDNSRLCVRLPDGTSTLQVCVYTEKEGQVWRRFKDVGLARGGS